MTSDEYNELKNRVAQKQQNEMAFEEAEFWHEIRWARFKRMILLPPPEPKKYPRRDLFSTRTNAHTGTATTPRNRADKNPAKSRKRPYYVRNSGKAENSKTGEKRG